MDAAGKDSTIKHMFEGVNPQGCEVASFKQPSTLELDHDFMWRAMIKLPERGHIGIFNRSYYEECLIVRHRHAAAGRERGDAGAHPGQGPRGSPDPLLQPYGCRRRPARGLGARPVQADRGEGLFLGRGTGDNKTGVTSLVSTILRMKAAGHRPRRTLVFAFVGDEETGDGDDPARRRARLGERMPSCAINTDAGGGGLTEDGKPVMYLHPGRREDLSPASASPPQSGRPQQPAARRQCDLRAGAGAAKIRAYDFPAMSNPITRGYFRVLGRIVPGAGGEPARRFAADPERCRGDRGPARHPGRGRNDRTTCVATMLDAGHAENALPQRASAVVNCRIFPGTPVAP